ncbi:MAG TPA: restriction endonuclease subunit S [bacterium]
MKFSDFVEINPKVNLTKGESYPCVMMDEVQPGKKYVSGYIVKKFTGGGSKFVKGDTLFARITPCLENGKITKFSGKNGDFGFGSTEFFIFRKKPGISDSDYIYYLSLTDEIRKPAESSMFGASGRQRADLNVVQNIIVDPPSIETQRKIAAILSAYDDLIENNIRRIQILEEMAQRIYREWFVHFRFPGHENVKLVDSDLGRIPEGWEMKKLIAVSFILMGQSPKSEYYNEENLGLPFHQGVKDFGEFFPQDRVYCSLENRIAEKGDILFSVRAPVGRINIANKKIIIGRGLSAIRGSDLNQCFLYYQLKNLFKEKDTIGGGTIFKAVTKDDMHSIRIVVPAKAIEDEYEKIVGLILKQIEILSNKNSNLRQTRDLLLPKLISEKIDVSDIDIETGNLGE